MSNFATVVVYPVRKGHSKKTDKDFYTQVIEILQSPVRPNTQASRLYNEESRALVPGTYQVPSYIYTRPGSFDLLTALDWANAKLVK